LTSSVSSTSERQHSLREPFEDEDRLPFSFNTGDPACPLVVDSGTTASEASEYSNAQRDIMIDAMADQDHLIRPYFCNVCNVICSGFASYQQHLEGTRHRRNEAPSSRELTCAICNISVNSEEQLNFHRHGTKHQRRAARQPPLLVPSASSTNQNSTAISHGQLLGSPNWYNSPPSHIPLPNTNNHASSSLNNDADNTFLNAVDHQAPYSLSTHSSLPDLISLLPGVMDDLSSAAKASVCEGRHSVESVSVSTPCFLASSAAAVQGSASLQCSLQSLMQETLNEIDRLEQQLARNLTRCRNSALLYRPRLTASRRRARRSLGCGETTRFSSFRLSALCPNSLARKSATSRSAVASALEVPSIHVQFCQHTICLSLRALLVCSCSLLAIPSCF
uniref:C2H2-type domain-containing protein n=1 Tax=Schistocephalus solidus TaxID=70667 RepID=A0A183T5S0_SCHSO